MSVLLGIEVGEEYLKLVLAQHKGMQGRLLDCFAEPIAHLNDADVALKLNEVVKKNKIRTKLAAVSLPRNFVTMRNLHLPSQDPGEIANMIGLHISRIVPYKKDEVVFSYHLSGTDDLGYSRVMLGIVYNEIIRRHITIVDNAGFLLDKITLSSYGSWRSVYSHHRNEIKPGELYLILDVDSTFTDFIIFNSETIIFTRSISIKASALAHELGRTKFLGEIRQSLLIFYNEEMNKKPVKAFVTGGAQESLAQAVQNELEIDVKFVKDYLSGGVQRAERRNIPKGLSLAALSQMTLETKGKVLSFVLPEIEVRKSLREKAKDLVVLGTFAVYLLGITCAIFLGRIYNQKFYLQHVEARSDEIEEEMGGLASQLDRTEFVNRYLKLRKLPLFVITEIQDVIPDTIAVSLLRIEKDTQITVRGVSLQLSEVFKMVTDLEAVKYFKDVQTKYTRKKKLRDKEITDFEVSFALAL